MHVLVIIQGKSDDMLVVHSDGLEVAVVDAEKQAGLAASSDAGDDLNHTVLLLCYELVKIPPSFNHRDSFASIIRIYTFLPYIVQKKNNPIKEFCVNNSYLYHFTVYKDGRTWCAEGYRQKIMYQ